MTTGVTTPLDLIKNLDIFDLISFIRAKNIANGNMNATPGDFEETCPKTTKVAQKTTFSLKNKIGRS